MKFILMLLLIPNLAFSYNVQAIYDKLVAANNVNRLPIVVKNNARQWCSLACSNGVRIVVTSELLSLVSNEDELAGVIGHEMAHSIYLDEMKADGLGLEYAKRAGYNYCKAAQLLKRFIADKEHPDGSIRYKNTGCP